MFLPGLVRPTVVASAVVVVSGALCCLLVARSTDRVVDAGFWFEPVSYDLPSLGGPVTAQEVETIATIARSELTHAFGGLPIRFSVRREARYRVRVVQYLRDLRFRRNVGIAGASLWLPGLGGVGEVSFVFAASGALAYAPEHASRASVIEAIGRGIGRAAVHELTHQLLPKAPIHDSTDLQSYEYRSASRREQYFGEMHWDLAWPLLRERLGPRR
jgi:hypothetical protein